MVSPTVAATWHPLEEVPRGRPKTEALPTPLPTATPPTIAGLPLAGTRSGEEVLPGTPTCPTVDTGRRLFPSRYFPPT